MSTSNKPFYPESCPECRSKNGMPYSAGTCDRPGVIVVKLRCRECGHEWTGEAPKASMASVALWPKADRRRHNHRDAR
jgi:hypothetical protein